MMSESALRSSHRTDREERDADLIGIVGDVDELILADTVEATCVRVEQVVYKPYNQTKLVLTFRIYAPQTLAGRKVRKYARFDERWVGTYIPESASIFKAACVARGRRLTRGERITKSMFLRKAYRLRLRQVGEAPASYTVVDKLLEKEPIAVLLPTPALSSVGLTLVERMN